MEEVRKHLERQYGAKALYENGLAVTTTLDARLQDLANKTIEHGLRAYDKRHGWRKPSRNILDAGKTLETYKEERWNRPIEPTRWSIRRGPKSVATTRPIPTAEPWRTNAC